MSGSDGTISKEFQLTPEEAQIIEYEARQRNVPEAEVLMDWMRDGFYVAFYDAEESVVKFRFIDPWSDSQDTVEARTSEGETTNTLKTFRRLREDFPPVSAGVDYAKNFSSGGGFLVQIDDRDNKLQVESKDVIDLFNRKIYQDEVTKGLDTILDIMVDEALTVGCSAAEIVYEGFEGEPFNFYEWVKVNPEIEEGGPQFVSNELSNEDWTNVLKGVVQLKIIDNAVERMKPYRNPETYKIEYWTVDEKEIEAWNQKNANKPELQKDVPKLLPWQVLWLSWGRRSSNLKGTSLIRPAVKSALLLEDILAAIGLSYKRWSDKKYFFILGDARTGRSWAPPRIREFMHNTNKMITSGSSGVPVQAGFDIKEIGGEAYDGSNVVDKLIGMICGGMKYPRTFLEQGKTQEGDKAWLAWVVTYATYQKLLRRSIENQLWERQLYCKIGLEQRVPKQGVAQENQERVPVYVPNMAWKSEGKWHQETKLEMLTGILNVANPVGVELKLEIESDISQTLGYSDLKFDNARKVLEKIQELQLIESEQDIIKANILLEALKKAKDDKKFLDDFVPQIGGLQKEEPEGVAAPLSRLAGGVSRMTKETGEGNKKGVAKPMGGSRQPGRKSSDTEETEDVMVHFETYSDLLDTLVGLQRYRSEAQETQAKLNVWERIISVLDKMDEVEER